MQSSPESAPRQAAPGTISAPLAAEAGNDQARRAAIVGQLAGGILHDLNNVLTVITGTIEILAEGVADRPQLAAVARLIDEAATRGARLATHLLAFARGLPPRPGEVDINLLLAEAVSLLRPTLGERIELSCQSADGLPAAVADASQLLAAVLSLGVAIRDAMPEGGALMLHAARGVTAGAVAIVADAVGPANANGHSAYRIELDFVASLVRQSGGALIVSSSEVGASVEIVLPCAAGQDG